ncbi:MAG TPA: MFS transporter [candidate division Zixibacteria bacterium]|nr:MFS transporter [candidate division Zixibacteria bacterium]
MPTSGIENTEEELTLEAIEGKSKFKQYLFYFSGQQASLLGSSIVSFAIIWWLTITTQSELMLGIASLVSLGPYIIAAPISGVLADKYNRKTLLITFDALQAMVTVILSILFLTDNISVAIIFVILGVRGTAQAFHQPVSMAVAPTMVPNDKLSRINGLSYLFSGVVNIIGPVVGAALLAIPGINIGMILWIDVGTFAIAMIPLIFIKIPSVTKKEKEEQEKQSFITQVLDGLNALRGTKGMLALLFGAMLINFFNTPLMALLSLFVNKTHMGNEADYALIVGMFQAAIVVGGLIMSFLRGMKRPVLFMIISVIFMYACQAALAFIPTDFGGRFWAIGSILFLFALPVSVVDVMFITSIQLLVPKEKMGRAIAAIMAIAPAIRPLGQFLSGLIAEFIGISLIFIIASGVGTIVIVILWFATPMKALDKEIARVMKEANGKDKEKIKEIETAEDGFYTTEIKKEEIPVSIDKLATQSIGSE